MSWKTLILALLAATAVAASAQEGGNEKPPTDPPKNAPKEVQVAPETGLVTIASRGQDVRNVLFDLFDQAKKSFVLEPSVRHTLYLALSGVEFEEALSIVCAQAGLEYTLDNGIYFVAKAAQQAKPTTPAPAPAKPKPLGKLTDQDLQKKLTTRLAMADIRGVFAEFGKQTGITIEVAENVPKYKVDAYLVDTSLKYALDVVTRAAGLVYVRTDNRTIRIEVKPKS
jgi:type II secretory pathway component GspD/PulD (secretin)